jgi:hypothetical protein
MATTLLSFNRCAYFASCRIILFLCALLNDFVSGCVCPEQKTPDYDPFVQGIIPEGSAKIPYGLYLRGASIQIVVPRRGRSITVLHRHHDVEHGSSWYCRRGEIWLPGTIYGVAPQRTTPPSLPKGNSKPSSQTGCHWANQHRFFKSLTPYICCQGVSSIIT